METYVVMLDDDYVKAYDVANDLTTITRQEELARKFDTKKGAESIATFVGGHVVKILN